MVLTVTLVAVVAFDGHYVHVVAGPWLQVGPIVNYMPD